MQFFSGAASGDRSVIPGRWRRGHRQTGTAVKIQGRALQALRRETPRLLPAGEKAAEFLTEKPRNSSPDHACGMRLRTPGRASARAALLSANHLRGPAGLCMLQWGFAGSANCGPGRRNLPTAEEQRADFVQLMACRKAHGSARVPTCGSPAPELRQCARGGVSQGASTIIGLSQPGFAGPASAGPARDD